MPDTMRVIFSDTGGLSREIIAYRSTMSAERWEALERGEAVSWPSDSGGKLITYRPVMAIERGACRCPTCERLRRDRREDMHMLITVIAALVAIVILLSIMSSGWAAQ